MASEGMDLLKVRTVSIDKDTKNVLTEEELHSAESTNAIQLKTSKTNCDYCLAPLEYIKRGKGSDNFVVYTRLGTTRGIHHEYRCTNRKSCRKGHYYGYSVSDKQINYDKNCLENEYLVTSRHICMI